VEKDAAREKKEASAIIIPHTSVLAHSQPASQPTTMSAPNKK
jgi:hypothetical protein